MKGWSWWSGTLASRAAPSTAAQARWRENDRSRSREPSSPLGVTLKLLFRRGALTSAATYTGADSTETAIPAMPDEPFSSCGLTLWRRFQK
jgi:hypothetical protein